MIFNCVKHSAKVNKTVPATGQLSESWNFIQISESINFLYVQPKKYSHSVIKIYEITQSEGIWRSVLKRKVCFQSQISLISWSSLEATCRIVFQWVGFDTYIFRYIMAAHNQTLKTREKSSAKFKSTTATIFHLCRQTWNFASGRAEDEWKKCNFQFNEFNFALSAKQFSIFPFFNLNN